MTADVFTLNIQLGNDAMSTREDVARALRAAADDVERYALIPDGAGAVIRDDNGNTVGAWVFEQR